MHWFMFSKGSVAGGEHVLLEVVVMMIVIMVLVMWIGEQRAFIGTIACVQVTGDVGFDLDGGHQEWSESR